MTASMFSRALGSRSGIQLNPVVDNTDRPAFTDADQKYGTLGRFVRGRIDKTFTVNQGNQSRTLGNDGSVAVNVLNESRVQIYEGLDRGATENVVSRLVPAAAAIKLIVVKSATTSTDVFTVATALAAGSLFSIKHLECFNDGLTVEVNAVEALDDTDTPVATKMIRLRLKDPADGQLLFPEFLGSLDPTAKDVSGNSLYLPDVVSATTDLVQIVVLAGATVLPTSVFYGEDATTGADKFVSAKLDYFTEGGTTYSPTDLDAAIKRLRGAANTYGYLSAGGSQNTQLITKLIAMGIDRNIPVVWSIPGAMTPAQAKVFYESIGNTDSMYSWCNWAPLRANDPLNGGKAFIGTEGIKLGLTCARNARQDSNGIAPKNYPIAGSDFPLNRSGVEQQYDPDEPELKMLATARINPVIFIDYASGGRFVFMDSLTGAKTEADRSMQNVADMVASMDNFVVRFCQECLQKPMDAAIKRAENGLKIYFDAVETAKWIIPSPELGNRSYFATIERNAQYPNKKMDVKIWTRCDGTNRQTEITHTLSK